MIPQLTLGQWFWLCYGAAGLFGGLRVAVSPEFRTFAVTDRCMIWVLTVCFWPIDFCMWLRYLYITHLRKAKEHEPR